MLLITSAVFLCICNRTHFSWGQKALVYFSSATVTKKQSESIIFTSAFKAYFPVRLRGRVKLLGKTDCKTGRWNLPFSAGWGRQWGPGSAQAGRCLQRKKRPGPAACFACMWDLESLSSCCGHGGPGSVWAGLGLVRLSSSSSRHCSQISVLTSFPPKHRSLPSLPSLWWEQPALAQPQCFIQFCLNPKQSLQKSWSWGGQRGLPVVRTVVGPIADGLAQAGHPLKVPKLDFNVWVNLNAHCSLCPVNGSPYE